MNIFYVTYLFDDVPRDDSDVKYVPWLIKVGKDCIRDLDQNLHNVALSALVQSNGVKYSITYYNRYVKKMFNYFLLFSVSI